MRVEQLDKREHVDVVEEGNIDTAVTQTGRTSSHKLFPIRILKALQTLSSHMASEFDSTG